MYYMQPITILHHLFWFFFFLFPEQIGDAPMLLHQWWTRLGLDAWSFEDLLFRADHDAMQCHAMRREKAQQKRRD